MMAQSSTFAMRIIPACAGNTHSVPSSMSKSRDHPRLRGEHHGQPVGHTAITGSSPLARGTHLVGHALHPSCGIIPACAGNTATDDDDVYVFGDHPRLRGEHGRGKVAIDSKRGSSPLARGTPVGLLCVAVCLGIIPACAGNTKSDTFPLKLSKDHPRLRGEHSALIFSGVMIGGSSPLARGTH